jgi:hypothetical protein
MYPATLPADDAFIANHHYRQIQRLYEESQAASGVP